MSRVPAGWYQDPASGRGQQRWWDGEGWSHDVRSEPDTAEEVTEVLTPVGEQDAAPSHGSGPAPGWYGDPTGRHGLRYWDGASWTADVRTADAAVAGPAPSAPRGSSAVSTGLVAAWSFGAAVVCFAAGYGVGVLVLG